MTDLQASQTAEQPENLQNRYEQDEEPKKKKPNVALKVIIWIIIILVVIALGLIITAFITPQFDNVFEMIEWIINEIKG